MFNALLNHHTPVERALEQHTGQGVESLPVPVRAITHPATCPAALLPWLAWHLSVDYWREDWDEATQRAVCQASVAVHRQKGTLAAVQAAIAATGLQADIGYDRHHAAFVPHRFRVRVDADHYPPTPDNLNALQSQLDSVKPARCPYALQFYSHFTLTVPVALGLGSHGRETSVAHYVSQRATVSAGAARGAGSFTHLKEARAWPRY